MQIFVKTKQTFKTTRDFVSFTKIQDSSSFSLVQSNFSSIINNLW